MATQSAPHEAVIEEVLARGVAGLYPSKEFLQERLLSGARLRLYLGIDPTAATLHLGHAAIFLKLRAFQALGHEVVLLVGDFTGLIGDPTDKAAARPRRTREELLVNAQKYQEQASRFLSFSGDNPARLAYNSAWLGRLSLEETLDLASHFTVQQFLERDMFQERLKAGKPVYLHEFLYPLLQGYDSVALETDGEIGGNDQTFNMLAGRALMKARAGKEKFVIAMRLLTDPSGKKMGKTEGNMVTLEDPPAEVFGKVMSWPDEMIVPGFELITDLTMPDIEALRGALEDGSLHPRDAKGRLARAVAALLSGEPAAHAAEAEFEKTFREKKTPDALPEIAVPKGAVLVAALAGRLGSNANARRRIAQGAVREIGGEKITDPSFAVTRDMDLRIGAHDFVRLKVA